MTGLDADLVVCRGGFTLSAQITIAPGEVVALLGPNGAGKSTAVRVLAGLLGLTAGRITLGETVLADPGSQRHVPAYARRVGLVFQDYLLFPHLSALDNVAFGPRARGLTRAAARERARVRLDEMGLTGLATARPRQLSGGQAQRVALARALATEPELLLLDEPLAALDARTRLTVRTELRRHLADYAGATLLVTHDPVDAAVLADRLIVLESGRVVQQGPPLEVARQPRTDYVARLVGLNLLEGSASHHAVRLSTGGLVHIATGVAGPVHLTFRPAAVSLYRSRPDGSPRNLWAGRIRTVEPHGDGVRVEVGGVPDHGSSVLAEVTPAAVTELELTPGRPVWAAVKASEVSVYPVERAEARG